MKETVNKTRGATIETRPTMHKKNSISIPIPFSRQREMSMPIERYEHGQYDGWYGNNSILLDIITNFKAPSAEDLAAAKLQNAQTKEDEDFDEGPYKASRESSSGDDAKITKNAEIAETFGLKSVPTWQ